MSDENMEREAFAAYITSQENIGFDAVVWRGVGGDPLGVVYEPQYSENSLRSEWAAWLARAALSAPTTDEAVALLGDVRDHFAALGEDAEGPHPMVDRIDAVLARRKA